MPQTATIKSLPRAFRMMKAVQVQGIEWGEGTIATPAPRP